VACSLSLFTSSAALEAQRLGILEQVCSDAALLAALLAEQYFVYLVYVLVRQPAAALTQRYFTTQYLLYLMKMSRALSNTHLLLLRRLLRLEMPCCSAWR
jgi:hypothetical protein